jgi:transposase
MNTNDYDYNDFEQIIEDIREYGFEEFRANECDINKILATVEKHLPSLNIVIEGYFKNHVGESSDAELIDLILKSYEKKYSDTIEADVDLDKILENEHDDENDDKESCEIDEYDTGIDLTDFRGKCLNDYSSNIEANKIRLQKYYKLTLADILTERIDEFISDTTLPKRNSDGKEIKIHERVDIINELFKAGEDLDVFLRALSDYQSAVSDTSLQNNVKFSKRKSQEKIWAKLKQCADYLLFIPENRGKQSEVHSKRTQERRKKYEENLVDAINTMNQEMLVRGSYSDYDEIEDYDELRSNYADDRKYNIAKLKILNYTQREIADKLNITRSKVRTTINKIEKDLEHHKPYLTPIEKPKKKSTETSKQPNGKTQLEKYRALNKRLPTVIHKPDGSSYVKYANGKTGAYDEYLRSNEKEDKSFIPVYGELNNVPVYDGFEEMRKRVNDRCRANLEIWYKNGKPPMYLKLRK